MKLVPFTPEKFRCRTFSQLWMLALQFFLGMILNLIGDGATGTSHIVYNIILVVHIINAVGLVEGGIYIALKEQSKLSWYAAIIVCSTLFVGIVFAYTKQGIWSFIMACGFLVSCWLNGLLYIQADRQIYNDKTQNKRSKKPAS